MIPAAQRAYAAGPVVVGSVNSDAELSAIGVSTIPDGSVAWITPLQQVAVLQTTSLALATNQVIASTMATRRWIVQPYPTGAGNPFATSLNWWFNSATGDDRNTGTAAGQPLATLAEWKRRIAGCTLSSGVYNLRFGAAEADPTLNLDLAGNAHVVLDFSAACTQVAAATVNAFTMPDDAAEYAYLTLVEAIDLTLHVDRLLQITHGANVYVAFVEVVNPTGGGNNTARISLPIRFDPLDDATTQGTSAFAGAIVNGDAVAILTLPDCGQPTLEARHTAIDATERSIIMHHFRTGFVGAQGGVQLISPVAAQNAFYAANFNVIFVQGNGWAIGCKNTGGGQWMGAGVKDFVTVIVNGMTRLVAQNCVFDQGTTVGDLLMINILADGNGMVGGGGAIDVYGGIVWFAGDHNMLCDITDFSVLTVLGGGSGVTRLLKTSGSLYGTNNIAPAHRGYWCDRPGVMFAVDAAPTLTCTGAGGVDTRICGVNNAWGAYPVAPTPQLSGVALPIV